MEVEWATRQHALRHYATDKKAKEEIGYERDYEHRWPSLYEHPVGDRMQIRRVRGRS